MTCLGNGAPLIAHHAERMREREARDEGVASEAPAPNPAAPDDAPPAGRPDRPPPAEEKKTPCA